MDPLSPFKSASAFQSPWSTSNSSTSPSSPHGASSAAAGGRHRPTNSSGSATGTGTGYRSSPLPQSASFGAAAGAGGGTPAMSSGAGAWGGEEVYTPQASTSGMGRGGYPYEDGSSVSASASASASGSGMEFGQMQQQQQAQPPQQQMFLRAKITGVERNRKDMLLRFDASTNLPNYRATMYRNMQRSYAEFQRFAEQAQATSPQTIISALPLASSSALTDEEDDRLVRIALQRWFSRICEDPVLMRDEELRSFVESDFGYSPTPPPSARRPTGPASAVPSVFSAALSKVVKRGPLEEDDELASAKAALEKLEVTWGGAAAGINALGKARRAYATASQDVGGKLISLSTVESDFGLQGAERKVGRALETIAGVSGAQAASENIILADTLGYQALNARAAKDALIQRTQLLEDSQTASKTAITKRRNVERLKGSNNISSSKVDDAIAEMEDAEQLETRLSKQLNAISTNLHLSLRQHSRHTHEDAAMALLENARLTVQFQKQALREMEIARAEVARVGGGEVPVQAQARVGGGATVQSQAPAQAYSRVQGESTGQSRAEGPLGAQRYDAQTPPAAQRAAQQYAPHAPQAPQAHFVPQPPQPQQPRPQHVPTGTQSMFLPPPSGDPRYPQFDPRQPLNGSGSGSASPMPQQQGQGQMQRPDPRMAQAQQQAQGQPHSHPAMAQSMVIPPSHQSQNGQRSATTGRQGGRRLDERQAARMLAGGF